MPIMYGGLDMARLEDRHVIEQMLQKAGLSDETFYVSVGRSSDRTAQEIVIMNVDRLRTKFYRDDRGWIESFSRDLASGHFRE